MPAVERTRRFLVERGKALRDRFVGPTECDRPSPTPELHASGERDSSIARLERELADEKECSAALRRSVDELSFRQSVLERSYAKQLADTRERADTAEQALAENRARNETLKVEHAKALQLLAASRAALERRPGSARTSPQAAPAAPAPPVDSGSEPGAPLLGGAWLPAQDGSMTINELMEDAAWRVEGSTPESDPADGAEPPRSADDPPAGELIAPELLLRVGDRNDR
jgi:hypothetical protein